MSIFSSLFSRKKKENKNYVAVFILMESVFGLVVFEKRIGDLLLVDSVFRKVENSDPGGISQLTDEIIGPIEKSIKSTIKEALFIVPSYAIDEVDGKVTKQFRLIIRELVKDFDLQPLGYVDLFESVRSLFGSDNSWVFVDRGDQNTNLILCNHDEIRKKLKVTSDADEICAHIEESATKKGVKVYYYASSDHDDMITFERNLAGYDWQIVTNEDIIKSTDLLLKEQLFGVNNMDQNVDANEVDVSQVMSGSSAVSTATEIDTNANDASVIEVREESPNENIIIEHNKDVKVANNILATSGMAGIHDESIVALTKESTPQTKVGDAYAEEKVVDAVDNFDDFQVFDPSAETSAEVKYVKDTSRESFTNDSQALTQHTDQVIEKEGHKSAGTLDTTAEDTASNVPVGSTKKSNIAPAIFSITFSWFLPGIFAIILAVILGTGVFLHKAEVILVAKTQEFEAEIKLKNYALETLSFEKEISARIAASGTKEIGERSQGQVIVASFSDKVASFSAGTKLVAGSKAFRLDSDVELEPASINTSQGTIVASKKSAKASATFIGQEGNIDKGLEMTISDVPKSLYYAVSETAFTGGSKQSVSAVSSDDIDALDLEIESSADTASREAMMSKLDPENDFVVTTLSTSIIDDIEYSAGVGDAVDEISANAIAKYTMYFGKQQSIAHEISSKIKSSLGDKYLFDSKSVNYSIIDSKLDEKTGRSADINIRAIARVYELPLSDKIKNDLVAMPMSQLDEKIIKPHGLVNVRQNVYPNLPPYTWFMPVVLQNIEVSVITGDGDL